MLNKNHHYIDKTEALEKGIEVFPSIYIEGAAGIGKTSAVKMLLEKYPKTESVILDAGHDLGTAESLSEVLLEVRTRMEERDFWLIIENMNETLSEGLEKLLVDFVLHMPQNGRVIFIGRERPGKAFLKLFWEKKMKIISKETLLFSKIEIEEFCSVQDSSLSAVELYDQTGGWAGCVDNMIRMASYYEKYTGEQLNALELRKTYEIDGYIQQEILGTLSEEEYELVRLGRECPWLNEILCLEVWKIQGAGEILEKLERKGIFHYNRQQKRFRISSLFKYVEEEDKGEKKKSDYWKTLAEWYEENHFIKEAVLCFEKSDDRELYRNCIERNYAQIPFLQLKYESILRWKEHTPQLCYLRGMYYYVKRDFKGLEREILRIEKQDADDKHLKQEILLNLYYLKPDFSLDDWIAMLENAEEQKYHLYNILGGAHTYLCGLRDLTGLFACTRKEENRKAKIWKSKLGDEEWKCYQLARLDYYLETDRQNTVRKEDYDLLLTDKENSIIEENSNLYDVWSHQFQLVRLYLLCKMQKLEAEPESEEKLKKLEKQFLQMEDVICRENAEAILSLYAPWMNNPEKLTRWLKYSEFDIKEKITEGNYFKLSCMVKGYLLLNQYEKAQRILRYLIPYMRDYRRQRLLAELLFQQAIINWELGRHGQALQNTIESFLINGNSRYVDCYASYGKKGKEVLESYVEWMKSNSPEGWHRKKKYQYGNVLRMPLQDYMEVILRCVRREARGSQPFSEESSGERLTMMETIILQDIGRGLSNSEICEELNLKLPTVKSHIYSLYKKLGANSRVQAVNKGKEMGVC